jgi:threonine synthase
MLHDGRADELPNDQPQNLSPEGWPLLARYDLDAMKGRPTATPSRRAPPCFPGFWKWRELLPVAEDEHVVSLGEVDTPLIETTQDRREDRR